MKPGRSHSWWKLSPQEREFELLHMSNLDNAEAWRTSKSNYVLVPEVVYARSMGLYGTFVRSLVEQELVPGIKKSGRYLVIMEKYACFLCDFHLGKVSTLDMPWFVRRAKSCGCKEDSIE